MKFNLQSKLGAWALISLIVFSTVPVVGCSAQSIAQNIINWTPALQSAVVTVNGTVATLDPAAAPILALATVGFNAASDILVAQAHAYLANPNASVLAQLESAVLSFQSSVSSSVLAAAKIVNPASQARALNAINGVATIVTAILALVSGIKGSTLSPASVSAPKLAQIEPLMDERKSIAIVAEHYGEPQFVAAMQIHQAERSLAAAGF